MLPETSSAKITAALVDGVGRFTSWRKRKSSLVMATAFYRLFQGSPAVQPGARAALVPAFALVVGLFHRVGAPGLQVGQLELLPQPVDDLVDLHLDHEAHFAVCRAAGVRAGAVVARGPQHVARLALALARALLARRLEQAQARVLEDLHRHQHAAIGRLADDVVAGEQVGQALAHRRAHLLVVAQPVARPPGEELVPGSLDGDSDHRSRIVMRRLTLAPSESSRS
jgi:hypothetical protein